VLVLPSPLALALPDLTYTYTFALLRFSDLLLISAKNEMEIGERK